MILMSQVLKMQEDVTSFDDLVPIVQALGEQGFVLQGISTQVP